MENLVQCVAWCENRCKFGWNGQAVTGSGESPIIPRLFRVEFVSPGKLGFLALRSDGTVEGFVEEMSPSGGAEFRRFELKLSEGAGKQSILSQRASGSILAVIEDEAGRALKLFKYASLQEQAKFIGQVPLKHSASKLIYHDSKRELLVYHCGQQFILQKFSLQQEPAQLVQERIIQLPFAAAFIAHSPRAAGVFVASAAEEASLALLNDNGELIKTYQLSLGGADLLLSPNGLLLGQVSFVNDRIPVLSTQPVAELNPKSKAR